MDLTVAIKQFFNARGDITLPPQLTIAGLAEMMYQLEGQAGEDRDRNCLRYWDFQDSRDGVAVDFTRAQINQRIKAVAARLQQVGKVGDRVAVLAGNSPEYIFGFIGALYAGMTPLPLYDPNEPGHADHLKAVFADAQPPLVLTNSRSAAAVRRHFSALPAAERPRVLVVDALPDTLADAYVNPLETPEGKALAANTTVAPVDMPAFLQYTSGSTRTPAGVLLTNRSIMTNVLQIFKALNLQPPMRIVSWLPLHHDMGIILALFVVAMGLPLEIMQPRDFVQQPKRWVDQLGRREGEDLATYTAVPNFALELAARYGAPEEGEELDLSNIDGLLIGSEPVTQAAVEAFLGVFEKYGLERTAIRPSYGMAEASLLVTTPVYGSELVVRHFDRAELAAGRAVPAEASDATVAYTSNGRTVTAQYLTIVDPETRAELPDGQVGEIWLHGENRAAGYLGRPEETAATFRNTLGERLAEGTRVAGALEDDYWLATGDLGAILEDNLFITGRLKDLIVIAGRNHYPQDIEATVQEASAQVRPDSVAAFSVDGADTEQLVLLIERADDADPAGDEQAAADIRAAVSTHHGLTPADIVFLAPLEIKRTSSGKIARRPSKAAYLAARA